MFLHCLTYFWLFSVTAVCLTGQMFVVWIPAPAFLWRLCSVPPTILTTYVLHARFTEAFGLSIGVNVGVNGCYSICALLFTGDPFRMLCASLPHSCAIGSSSPMTHMQTSSRRKKKRMPRRMLSCSTLSWAVLLFTLFLKCAIKRLLLS